MIIGAVGMGKRYLNRTSATEKYLAEGSYPVYIIHQTVIVIIAFYVVDFAIPSRRSGSSCWCWPWPPPSPSTRSSGG